jgi:hypothetical protein
MGILGWLSKLFSGLGKQEQYGIQSETQRGETVRSRGEQRIADYLHRNNIRYHYEDTAYSRHRRISHPDFHLLDYNVYIEYWGMVDVEDGRRRENYVKSMRWKMAQYHKNHIRFISLYPSNLDNLDWIFRAKFKRVTGRELPRLSAK